MSIVPLPPIASFTFQGGVGVVCAGKGVALSATPIKPQKFITSELDCLEIDEGSKATL